MRNSPTSPKPINSWEYLHRGLLFALILASCAASSPALDPDRLLSQYMREHWGSERGFNGGSVTSIAQTADGYLWIGTDKGLFRFDGFSFRDYPQAVPNTFPIGPVRQLIADNRGNLWILLQNTKILRYHNAKFDLGREEAEFGITSATNRANGDPLFSSLALGVLSYSNGKFERLPASGEFASLPNPTPEGSDVLSSRLSWATGVVPHRFAEPNSAVLSMAQSGDGRIWLGTRDKGLFFVSDGKVSSAAAGFPNLKINCILPLPDQQLWIGTDNGLLRWTGTRLTPEGIPPSLRHTQILAMLRDRDSNTWIGTPNGLVRANSNGLAVDDATLRITGPVNALLQDREGNLWVGTTWGIDRLRDSVFITYRVGDLASESPGSVFVDEVGRTWFSPSAGGLHWIKGQNSGAVTKDRLGLDTVYSIAGSNHELWLGRQNGGLTHLRFENGREVTRTYTHNDGLAQDSVYAVHENRDATLWAGTLSGGVSELRNGHFTTFTTANGLPSNTVVSIAEGPDDTMWFATPNGIGALRKGRWSAFGKPDGLPSENVNCLLVDSHGALWAGTASGLAILRADKFQTPAQNFASLQEQVLGIAEDKNGWLWISTSNHVLRVNRAKLLAGDLADTDLREYGVEDGLLGVEGVKRHQSVFKDTSGKIWFSMNRGLSVADPSRAMPESSPAIVQIEGVTVDGTPVITQDPIRLTGRRRAILFNYAAMSLSVPERVRYKYKLDGVDEGWSSPVTSRQVSYNNLGSGPYRFRLMASNSDGIWNGVESDISFQIVPEYWQTWWFRSAAALVCGLFILLLYRLRVRQLAAQMNMRFEERLAERTRIAQELHDTLLQGFLSASMQLHVADDRLPEGSPAKPLIRRTLDLMSRVSTEGRNTVSGLRSSGPTSHSLEESFTRFHQELAPSSPAEFRVIVEGVARPLHPLIRDEIYSIGREAIANAFHHSRATEIGVEIEYTLNHLRILVRDNGIGIDPNILAEGRQGHWGLSGMRERAERIAARLRVLSRDSAGTEIELSVPSRVAFELRRPERSRLRPSWQQFRKLITGASPPDSEKHS